MTIYDALGLVDGLESACFQSMSVPGSGDDLIDAEDMGTCARLAAQLAGEAHALLLAPAA